MEITLENVERALAQFYHTNSTLQAEAHQWLIALQSSPNAWAIVWELLQPNRSCEAQFFAATTLHMKLMKQWNEVPVDQYENLKAKLLEVIIQYSAGPKIVLNRLCIALSAFLIQTTPKYWPNSLQDLLDLIQPGRLPNIPEERTLWILLEVLLAIPEEFQTMTLANPHKQAVRQELEQTTPKVISLIENLLGYPHGAEMRAQAVKAVLPWLALGTLPLPSCINFTQKLVTFITLQANDVTESCESETDALTHITTHPNTHLYSAALLQILEVILPLRHLVINSENQDFTINIYKLFITFGETHTKLIIDILGTEKSEMAKALIQFILKCVSTEGQYPRDECISQLTFSFWYILQDELSCCEKEVYERAQNYIVPAYEQLCSILLIKSKLPADNVQLTAAEAEQLRIYRQDVADTIVCCYNMTREYLLDLLMKTMSTAQTWQDAEAVIEVVISLAETAWSCVEDPLTGALLDTSEVEQSTTGKLTRLLISVPPHLLNNRLINSINHGIGAYAEWWSYQRDILEQLIPTLVASIQNPETSTSATMALKDLTRECTTSLLPYAENLLNACQDALAKERLKQVECLRLMYSIGRLLSILPYDLMLIRLEPLISGYTTDLERLLNEPLNAQVKSALLLRLRLLTTISSSLYLIDNTKLDPPTLLILRRLLPILDQLSNQHAHDPILIQEICNCLKSCVLNLLKKCESLLEAIVNITLTCYSSQPNTAALDLTRQLFILFGKSTNSTGILHSNQQQREEEALIVGLVRSISITTISIFINNKASEASDVIQSYYQLTSNIVKKFPTFLHLAVNPIQLFKLATLSLLLPENGTVKSAGIFLCAFITQSREHPVLYSAVQENGEHLVHTVIRCIGGETPRSGLDIFSDILLALNKKYCDNLARWLNSVLGQENFPTEKATTQAKAHFTKMILRERSNRPKVLGKIKEFALICRGLVTSDYNLQTTN